MVNNVPRTLCAKELRVPTQTTAGSDVLCRTKVHYPELQSGGCSTHRTKVLCGECRHARRGHTTHRLGWAALPLQNDFDWLDLRSYDIRVTTRHELFTQSYAAVTPLSQTNPAPPCQGPGTSRPATSTTQPTQAQRSVTEEDISTQSLRIAYCYEHP